ncbi:hypothetical protein KC19_VG206700 [Ceratodon purpureus]|uniref:Transposase-associated domain-containing protein n=1 Tax=Ceratodon purpureus TaxID=3225 RepID=A0A8T0HT96_CERPU|nr:hypothetical protein KC19_VG206700 [Ceratodon purpureus]
MAGNIRRSVPDERRIRAREAKLLQRELQLAATKGLIRLRCPCNLCMKEQHSLKILTNYRRCLRANRRHPWFFWSTEGYEGDSSNDEWDDHMSWYYGAQVALGGVGNVPAELDLGMDVQRMLIESLDMADRIYREATKARETVNVGTTNMHSPSEECPDQHSPLQNPLEQPVPDEPPVTGSEDGRGDENMRSANEENPVCPDAQPMEVENAGVGLGDIPGTEGGVFADFVLDKDLSWGENENDDDAAVSALEEAAATPLYHGSEHSSMGATYLLLSLGKLHNCSSTYLDELLRTLSMTVLPQPNSLPRSYQEASEYLKPRST